MEHKASSLRRLQNGFAVPNKLILSLETRRQLERRLSALGTFAADNELTSVHCVKNYSTVFDVCLRTHPTKPNQKLPQH